MEGNHSETGLEESDERGLSLSSPLPNEVNEQEPAPEPEKKSWFYSSILNGIIATTRTVGGKEIEEALSTVLELLGEFFSGRSERYAIDAFLSLILLAIYYQSPKLRTSMIEDSGKVIRESSHYFKFAAAAYGWKLMNGIMFDQKKTALVKGFWTGDQHNNYTLCEHTGIKEKDIIFTKWTSDDFHPAHYFVVDHKSESLVLAIRGTFHLKDALTDMIAHSVPFQDGTAHNGILQCALKKLESIKADMLDELSKWPGYRLVLVGHSLGAGTATLMTLLLKEEYPDMDIHCFAYAAPGVVDIAKSKSCVKYISSYALEDDVIPRLSYGSMKFLQITIVELMGESTSNTHRLLQALAAGGTYSELVSKKVAEVMKYENHMIDTGKIDGIRPFLEDKLFPAGQMYHLLKSDTIVEKGVSTCKDSLYHMEHSDCSIFSEIIVSGTMFSNHMPNAYNKAFNGIRHHQSLVRHGIIDLVTHKENKLFN